MERGYRSNWEEHWRNLSGRRSLFGRFASLVRLVVLSRAVRSYADRFFPTSGMMVEMGCGTGQASSLILRRRRSLMGLDFSTQALLQARDSGSYGGLVQADIGALPFRDSSLDGLWNLGVMEHFEPARGAAILEEFSRVLKPGAHLVLFWPPEHGSSRLVLGPIEGILSAVKGRTFRFFPDEVNRLRSREHGCQILTEAGFEEIRAEHSWRDAFIHIVLVGRKV